MRFFTALLLLCLLAPAVNAQSKKELKVQQMLLQAQINQLKDRVSELQRELKEVKSELGSCQDSLYQFQAGQSSDTIFQRYDSIRLENQRLKEELFNTRISQAEKKLHPRLKQREYVVRGAVERRELSELHKERYLTHCLKFNNPQRLFTEEILMEFEVHASNDVVKGFLRKRYVPEIGSDQYNMQKFVGNIRKGEKLNTLYITDIDGKKVDIQIVYGRDRDLYNEIKGEADDLSLISTLHGGIGEFSFRYCRNS